MNITLRQLQIFAEAATQGNISKASETLFLSQSAVSLAIADLERILGVKLFDRISRNIYLNDTGRAMLPKALKTLESAKEIETLFRSGTPFGKIRIGASTTIGNYLLPSVLGNYMEKFNHADIALEVGNTKYITEKLRKHEYDAVFVEGPVSGSDIICTPWLDDELIPFCSIKNIDTNPRDIQWIIRESGSGTREIFEQAMNNANLPLNIKMELGHTEAIKKAAEAGLGHGCLSILAVQREIELGYLQRVEIKGLNLKRKFSLLILKEKYITEGLKNFLKHCGIYL